MKTTIKSALVALALLAGASMGPAQAETAWHFPYKGAPYATQSGPAQRLASVQSVRKAKPVATRARLANRASLIR